MVETISPAVCGTRRRTALALALFAAGAIGVAALRRPAARRARLARRSCPSRSRSRSPACCASPALLRLPVPQSRRQVPERWHHALPLPVWSLGYGAGLGVGVLTYQPVATFLVVAVAAAASGTDGRRARADRVRHRPRRSAPRCPPPSSTGWRRSTGRCAASTPSRWPRSRWPSWSRRPARPRSRSAPAASSTPPSSEDGTLAYTQRADNGATAVRRPCRRPARRSRFAGASRAVGARRVSRLPRRRPA